MERTIMLKVETTRYRKVLEAVTDKGAKVLAEKIAKYKKVLKAVKVGLMQKGEEQEPETKPVFTVKEEACAVHPVTWSDDPSSSTEVVEGTE